MESSGIQCGANPNEWFASFKDIPLKNCINCEIWDGFKWILYEGFNNQKGNEQ